MLAYHPCDSVIHTVHTNNSYRCNSNEHINIINNANNNTNISAAVT